MKPLPSLAPTFDEPLEMLEACHGRIESQLATLERLVQHLARHGCDAEARAAARAVMRYFDSSGVEHHRDEDSDLFPLLRRLAADEARPEIAAVIDELEREHASMDLQWSQLRAALDDMVNGRAAELDAGSVERFAWLYRKHIEREEAAVLPFAKEALGAEARAELGRRMAARRGARR